jgi:Activator of Hsp90 ATPase homolog 1-like protein
VSDPDELTYREASLTRIFDAPREVVWQAWTQPEQVSVWWGPRGMSSPLDRIEMDLRPGGADLGGRTELTNHFAGYTNDRIAAGARVGTGQQLDKLERHLAATFSTNRT